jgi:hypothetical protein
MIIPDARLFEAYATETYTNVLGSTNTVVVLRPFDIKRLEPYVSHLDAVRRELKKSKAKGKKR